MLRRRLGRTDLPLDRRRPALQTFRGAQAALDLPEGLATELRALEEPLAKAEWKQALAGFGR
jgi:hypothetical protein